MCKLRRVTAVLAVLYGAALVLAQPTTSAYAASSSSATVHADGAAWKYGAWKYYATYPNRARCLTIGETQVRNWQCVPNQAGAYDLYLWY
jgi:hypothetical protein